MFPTPSSPPMSADERRALLNTPISFTVIGGRSHGGAYRLTDEHDERNRERYLGGLLRRKIAEDNGQ